MATHYISRAAKNAGEALTEAMQINETGDAQFRLTRGMHIQDLVQLIDGASIALLRACRESRLEIKRRRTPSTKEQT